MKFPNLNRLGPLARRPGGPVAPVLAHEAERARPRPRLSPADRAAVPSPLDSDDIAALPWARAQMVMCQRRSA